MGKSFIYAVNQNTQNVAENGIVQPASVVRRFGCNLGLSGDGIEVRGDGYYTIDTCIVCAPSAEGEITATLYKDGVPISGAVATATVTEDAIVMLPIAVAIRETCCDSASSITCGLSAEASVINFTMRVEKL